MKSYALSLIGVVATAMILTAAPAIARDDGGGGPLLTLVEFDNCLLADDCVLGDSYVVSIDDSFDPVVMAAVDDVCELEDTSVVDVDYDSITAGLIADSKEVPALPCGGIVA